MHLPNMKSSIVQKPNFETDKAWQAKSLDFFFSKMICTELKYFNWFVELASLLKFRGSWLQKKSIRSVICIFKSANISMINIHLSFVCSFIFYFLSIIVSNFKFCGNFYEASSTQVADKALLIWSSNLLLKYMQLLFLCFLFFRI